MVVFNSEFLAGDHDVIFRRGLGFGLKMTEFMSSDDSPQFSMCVLVCVGLRLTDIRCLKSVPPRTGFLQTNRVGLWSVCACLSFRFLLCILAQPDGNAQMRSLCAMTHSHMHASISLSQQAADMLVK